MNLTKTPNTLLNNDDSGTIAYGRQLKDDIIDWTQSKYNKVYPNPTFDPTQPVSPLNPETLPYFPEALRTDAGKFQSSLNNFFLDNWYSFMEFLHEEGVNPTVIDSWKEVEDFLAGISEDETTTLLNLIEQSKLVRGTMNIAMSQTIPGMLEATTNVLVPNIEDSHIDEETGIIRMVYKFE